VLAVLAVLAVLPVLPVLPALPMPPTQALPLARLPRPVAHYGLRITDRAPGMAQWAPPHRTRLNMKTPRTVSPQRASH